MKRSVKTKLKIYLVIGIIGALFQIITKIPIPTWLSGAIIMFIAMIKIDEKEVENATENKEITPKNIS